MKYKKKKILEAQRTPSTINAKKHTQAYHFQTTENHKLKKKKSWKKPEGGKRYLTYREAKIKIISYLPQKPGRQEEQRKIFKVLREENHQHRTLYPVKLSFNNKREIQTFSDKNEGDLFPVDLRCKKC